MSGCVSFFQILHVNQGSVLWCFEEVGLQPAVMRFALSSTPLLLLRLCIFPPFPECSRTFPRFPYCSSVSCSSAPSLRSSAIFHGLHYYSYCNRLNCYRWLISSQQHPYLTHPLLLLSWHTNITNQPPISYFYYLSYSAPSPYIPVPLRYISPPVLYLDLSL